MADFKDFAISNFALSFKLELSLNNKLFEFSRVLFRRLFDLLVYHSGTSLNQNVV